MAWPRHASQSLPATAGHETARALPNETPQPLPPVEAPPSDPDSGSRPALPDFLPPEASDTIALIRRGGPFPHRQDGGTFGNREGHLPRKPRGWYREYTVDTPGLSHRGASRIVSSVSVYNELLRRRPDLVERLYEPFLLDTRDESGEGRRPVIPVPPCRFAGGRLRTFYHSDYFRSAVRHPEVPPFDERERALLDLYEEIAASPELYLDMQFEVGDVQLLSNHTVLHARTAYVDHAEPERKRHLLRLWLSLR